MRLRHPGGLAAMSMNFFAFFLGAGQSGYNPNASVKEFFASQVGPGGDRFTALGGQGILIVSYSRKQAENGSFAMSSRGNGRTLADIRPAHILAASLIHELGKPLAHSAL